MVDDDRQRRRRALAIARSPSRPTRQNLNTRVNSAIEREFALWSRAESCHTGGALCLSDLERLAVGQVFEAGEIFIRKHRSRFGDSRVPLALEIIESERVADDLSVPAPALPGAEIRMGVEVDEFGRALAYWMRERTPGELRYSGGTTSNQLVRVPASEIVHLRIIDRWPQTRGEPWMHTVVRKLNDMDSYTEAEIIAARAAASYMGFV